MKEMPIAVEIESVSKKFELSGNSGKRLIYYILGRKNKSNSEFEALKEVSFSLKVGETLGIIGRNGSGKSTLLQIICGTLTPTTGRVMVNGRVAALLELGAGFNPEFTGRENILLNASIYGLDKKTVYSRMDSIIDFAEIGDFIDQPVKHYSSGMFVRLAFAVIVHVDADILVIDEALAVGDALFAQKCMRFLEKFKEKGSILFVSHDSGAITKLCERALWLDRGKVMMLGAASKVSEAYLEHLYASQQSVEMEQADPQSPAKALSANHDVEWVDARADLLLNSLQRNDFNILRFNPDGSAFGTGLVQLQDVYLTDNRNRRVAWAVGGSQVHLVSEFVAREPLDAIIVGFMIKDRLGQVLFGDNNCIFHQETPVNVLPDQLYRASYTFILPYLPLGDYVVTVAIASGTQQEHVQHCWRHDALLFSVTSSHVVHGLMGVPVTACEIIAMEGGNHALS